MTNTEFVKNEYFRYLASHLVCPDLLVDDYTSLLSCLLDEKFTYIIKLDFNRAADGLDMRRKFASETGIGETVLNMVIGSDCSVLEMMVGLAARCENDIMSDWEIGDRTPLWFWSMINSLGLLGMTNEYFDKEYYDRTMRIFLNRRYNSNGAGGLFTINNPEKDMRNVEIWYQMMYYLNQFISEEGENNYE